MMYTLNLHSNVYQSFLNKQKNIGRNTQEVRIGFVNHLAENYGSNDLVHMYQKFYFK